MTRKILAISLILASNMGVAREGLPPNWGTLLEKWEAPVLVLLSLALQVILALLANQRKYRNNVVIRIIIWSAYMAADSVATFTLGAISSNLRDALKLPGSLDASTELATFWAPFLLVHLGGQDTITAYALQDTELWLRHFSNLIVETGMAFYIFFGVMKRSRLSTLSAMMLVAGVIKYGERTLCLWFASYDRRQAQTLKDYGRHTFGWVDENVENELDEELLATNMFQKTELMFADVVLPVDQKSYSKRIVQTKSSSVVSKLITMELELMYENLYTKAKVTHSCWGLAFRLISFLLTSITLILFSRLDHRYNYSTFQLYVSYLLLGVAMLLEGYAAFVFLTSCRTISWLREHGMDTVSQAMRCLSSLRSRGWSNSMGQYSVVSKHVGPKPMDPFRKVISILHWKVLPIIRQPKLPFFVYESQVKDYVKEGIHQYLNQAEAKYNGSQFSIVNSRGRVPLTTWNEQYGKDHHGGAEVDPITRFNFDLELGEMVIIWHNVTEVCYYLDYDSLKGEKGNTNNPSKVYRDWKMSKYLSRYMMQLYVVSSDMLPPRGPLSEQKFFNYFGEPDYNANKKRGGTSNREEERNGNSADHQQKKQRRKRDKVQISMYLWGHCILGRLFEGMPDVLITAYKLIEALLDDDDEDRGANASKREYRWKLLNEVWIELLVNVASQCRGNQHAQHLRQGGEFLTHV